MKNSARRNVRRVEIEKVKNGKGGHMHKVTAHYHDSPAKEGKGMKNAMPSWTPPEETYHSTHGAMKKHVGQLCDNMTASADESPNNDSEQD